METGSTIIKIPTKKRSEYVASVIGGFGPPIDHGPKGPDRPTSIARWLGEGEFLDGRTGGLMVLDQFSSALES
jgi:hypothetical protein